MRTRDELKPEHGVQPPAVPYLRGRGVQMSLRSRSTRAALVLVVAAAMLASMLAPAPRVAAASPAGITFVHDDAGRLLAVIDLATTTAVYSYDATGNIVSIANRSSSILSVLRVAPLQGRAGSSVSIWGTAFSATASNDVVKFNGTPAVVTSASATQLVVTVPAGVTAGPVTVTVGATTVTSSSTFRPAAPAPTITSPSRVIAPGTNMTVTGSGFDPNVANDKVSIGQEFATVSSATATQLSITIPSGPAFTGQLVVTTPHGTAAGPDVFVVPKGFTAAQVASKGRLTPGVATRVTVPASSDIAMVAIDSPGQARLALDLTNPTIASGEVTIYAPGGYKLPSGGTGSFATPTAGGFMDPASVPTRGTYVVIVSASSGNSGSVTLTPYFVVDQVGTITPNGGAVTANITTPGQRARFTFNGTAGQQISADVKNGTFKKCGNLSLVGPDGTQLASGGGCLSSDINAFLDSFRLPTTGTYTLTVDPSGDDTGTASVRLYSFTDQVGTITANGAAMTATITKPGQKALFTFAGAAGQQVSAYLQNGTFTNCTDFALLKPDKTRLVGGDFCGQPDEFIDATTLPVAGTYTLAVDPFSEGTGSASISLFSFTDQHTPITINGGAVTAAINKPGQRALLTFTGAAGQHVSVHLTNGTFASNCGNQLLLLKPDGSTLASSPDCYGTTASIASTALPVAGTYTVDVDPNRTATGSASISVTSSSSAAIASPASAAPAGPAAVMLLPPPTARLIAATGPSAGTAGLHGRVLKIDGKPLAGVTLSVGQIETTTDATGGFLLSGLAAGHQVLLIDGSTAGPSGQWGIFKEGVDLVDGKTAELPNTIWMTPLDTAHTVTIASPTRGETVVTNPAIPGLELHLAPGTVIRDRHGNVVRRLTLTAIPIARTPIPLPPFISLPTYFTIQPADATLSKGAHLVYPNWSAQPPGVRLDFWDYTPSAPNGGWWIYGQGTVNADATRVVPDRDVELYDFDGAMINSGSTPPSTAPAPDGGGDGDPVDLSS